MGKNDILAKLAIQIAADNSKLGATLQQSTNQLKSFTTTVQAAGRSLGIAFGGAAIVQGILGAINSIKELDQQLATVQAITGATAKEFDALRASSLRLGGSTQFTAKQVAELQTEFGRLGFSVKEILQATEATIQLATATGEDLAKSADTAGSTIRAFGLDASETQRIVDVMAEAFNKSALGLENFTEAMKYVAPIAKSANIGVEETTALLGTLADAGIRGSQAGTSLRRIITDLAKDGRPLAVRLKELADKGLTFAQANDEVGRTAYASLLILARETEKTERLTNAFNNAEGAAKAAADIVGNTLAGDLKKLSGAYDSLVQSTSSATSVLREFVQAGTGVLQMLNGQNGVLGEYVGYWIKLVFTVPRAIAAIVNGLHDLTKDNTIQELIDQFNTDFINEPFAGLSGESLESLKNIEAKAKAAGIQLLLLRDEFGKTQLFIKNNPVKTVIDYGVDDTIKVTIETIQSLEDKIKQLRKTQEEETPIGDILGLQRLEKQIESTKLKLELLKNAIAGVKPELSTTSLTNNPFEDSASLASLKSPFSGATELEQFKIPPVDGKEYLASLQHIRDASKDFVSEMGQQFIDLGPMIAGGLTEVAQSLGKAAAGIGDFGTNILKALGDFAQQFGALLIAMGVGRVAFESGTGPQQIAAGVLLVAAGAALSALSSKRSTIISGAQSGSFGRNENFSNVANIQDQRVQVTGTIVLRGQDAWILIKNYQDNNNFTRG